MSPQEQPVLSFPSDTAAPVAVVPIFYFHDGEHPFCHNEQCVCHQQPEHLRKLLIRIIRGDLKLRQTYRGKLIGKGITGHAAE